MNLDTRLVSITAVLVPDVFRDRPNEIIDIDVHAIFSKSGIEARILENLPDEFVEAFGLPVDLLELVQFASLTPREFERDTQPGKWGSQLMRDVT